MQYHTTIKSDKGYTYQGVIYQLNHAELCKLKILGREIKYSGHSKVVTKVYRTDHHRSCISADGQMVNTLKGLLKDGDSISGYLAEEVTKKWWISDMFMKINQKVTLIV